MPGPCNGIYIMRISSILLAVLGMGLLSLTASAAPFTLSFDQSSYGPQSGDVINVKVLLTDTGFGTNPTFANQGLYSAGMYIEQTSGPSGALTFQGFTPNPGFDDWPNAFYLPMTDGLGGFLGFGNLPDGIGLGSETIELGTFSFLVQGVLGTQITISPAHLPPGINEFVLADGTPIDSLITTVPSTITITPEPGTLVLFGVVAGVGAFGYRRRRQGKKSAA